MILLDNKIFQKTKLLVNTQQQSLTNHQKLQNTKKISNRIRQLNTITCKIKYSVESGKTDVTTHLELEQKT